MDKNDILKALKNKVYYAELPSKMDVCLNNNTLHIIIGADGVLQNMQNDASAFEGWVFCIKSFFSNITNVIIDWEEPVLSLEEKVQANQRKHFNRFLLRVVWFIENYPWATVAESKKETIEMFGRRISQLTLNFPLQDSKDKSEKGDNDRAMKYEAMLETAVYQYLSTLGNANHQLPMGIFDGAVSKATAITPGGASQADLWRIDNDMFCVYELKDCINSDNTHVGIITELMFYANVLHRLLITNEIQYPHEADKFRTGKREKASRGLELILDAIQAHSITHIKALLLTDRLHPLIEYSKKQLESFRAEMKANGFKAGAKALGIIIGIVAILVGGSFGVAPFLPEKKWVPPPSVWRSPFRTPRAKPLRRLLSRPSPFPEAWTTSPPTETPVSSCS